jgi:hypothetical protein
MTDAEQRSGLEAIARDEDAYPSDRIAAVKALQGMGRQCDDELAAELDRILRE